MCFEPTGRQRAPPGERRTLAEVQRAEAALEAARADEVLVTLALSEAPAASCERICADDI